MNFILTPPQKSLYFERNLEVRTCVANCFMSLHLRAMRLFKAGHILVITRHDNFVRLHCISFYSTRLKTSYALHKLKEVYVHCKAKQKACD
jgi:hypothetical protein